MHHRDISTGRPASRSSIRVTPRKKNGCTVRPCGRVFSRYGRFLMADNWQRRPALFLSFLPLRGLYYGIGLGPGTGATPQIADAQGGKGGVGISISLPWVAAEPPLMQAPVNVSPLR